MPDVINFNIHQVVRTVMQFRPANPQVQVSLFVDRDFPNWHNMLILV